MGAHGGFLRNGYPFSRKMCPNHSTIINFEAPRNSEADPADPAFSAFSPETQPAVRNRPWVPRAGGQDYGSLHKLPQITFYRREVLIAKPRLYFVFRLYAFYILISNFMIFH